MFYIRWQTGRQTLCPLKVQTNMQASLVDNNIQDSTGCQRGHQDNNWTFVTLPRVNALRVIFTHAYFGVQRRGVVPKVQWQRPLIRSARQNIPAYGLGGSILYLLQNCRDLIQLHSCFLYQIMVVDEKFLHEVEDKFILDNFLAASLHRLSIIKPQEEGVWRVHTWPFLAVIGLFPGSQRYPIDEDGYNR